MHPRQILPGIALVLSLLSTAAHGADENLLVLLNPKDYVQPVYSERPELPAPYVYFQGESIGIGIIFANWGERPLTLDTNSTQPDGAVSVRLFRRNGRQTVQLPVRFNTDGPVWLLGQSSRFDGRWDGGIELPPGSRIVIPGVLQTDALEPGTYELRLAEIHVACSTGCGVRDQAGQFFFEIRSVADVRARLDRLFRLASDAIERDRIDEADAPIREMLELHPDASGAYQLIARRAERLERWPEAAEAYDRAAALIEKGRDRLRPHPRPDLLIDSLRASAAHAREGPGER